MYACVHAHVWSLPTAKNTVQRQASQILVPSQRPIPFAQKRRWRLTAAQLNGYIISSFVFCDLRGIQLSSWCSISNSRSEVKALRTTLLKPSDSSASQLFQGTNVTMHGVHSDVDTSKTLLVLEKSGRLQQTMSIKLSWKTCRNSGYTYSRDKECRLRCYCDDSSKMYFYNDEKHNLLQKQRCSNTEGISHHVRIQFLCINRLLNFFKSKLLKLYMHQASYNREYVITKRKDLK